MVKHDLFLFYEENEDDRVISSKIVRLYMNRFIIEEDRQNEIVGVKNLTKPVFPEDEPWVSVSESEKIRKIDMAKWRSFGVNKLTLDVHVLREAFEKIQNVIVENKAIHFIVGSTFYMEFFSYYRMRLFRKHSALCGQWNEFQPIENLIINIIDLLWQFNIGNSFSCSFVAGCSITLRMVSKMAILL